MNSGFNYILRRSLGLYGLFMLPTIILLVYTGQTDASISAHIGNTWQAGFWHFPGLGAKGSRVLLDVLTAFAVGGLGWLFYRGWHILAGQTEPLSELEQHQLGRKVLLWTALCGGVLLAVVPFHSSDMYGYLNRGFQQSLYHTNPYLTPIAAISGWKQEPMFHAHWIYNPCPYGFFFAQLAAGITALCGRHFLLAFLAFKFLNWLLLLATTWLVLQLGKALRLERPWLAAYSFGANPLVLLHVMGNGHNDIVMVGLLMAALYVLSMRQGRWLALPVLVLSILVKYASLLALPFVGLYLLKQRDWRSILLGGAVSLLLLALLASVYVDPHQPWPWADMLDNAGKPQHSVVDMLASAVYYPLKWVHAPADAVAGRLFGLLKPLFWGGFVLFYLRQLWQFIRKDVDLGGVVAASGVVMTVMAAFISAKFHPWYAVMFLPLLLVLPESNRWRQFGQNFSLFQLAGFTIFQNLPVISPLVLTVLPAWLAFRHKSPFSSIDRR
jgi:hypothetical protein